MGVGAEAAIRSPNQHGATHSPWSEESWCESWVSIFYQYKVEQP